MMEGGVYFFPVVEEEPALSAWLRGVVLEEDFFFVLLEPLPEFNRLPGGMAGAVFLGAGGVS